MADDPTRNKEKTPKRSTSESVKKPDTATGPETSLGQWAKSLPKGSKLKSVRLQKMSQVATSREPLEKLKNYPAFQNLRDKAETHQLQFRPKESKLLKKHRTFNQVLDERTQSAWNAMV